MHIPGTIVFFDGHTSPTHPRMPALATRIAALASGRVDAFDSRFTRTMLRKLRGAAIQLHRLLAPTCR